MLVGRSYYHTPQNLGRAFVPGKLEGYFNDLTGKTHWLGRADNDGVPINTLSTGQQFQFPNLIIQKSLGHWDQWSIKKNEQDKQAFQCLCDWLVKHQEPNGAWDTWQVLRGEQQLRYSAMTQGQALSALSRAWNLTQDRKYVEAATRAFKFMQVPIQQGGVTYFEPDGVFLEELPCEPRNTILNGWIFALFGLYDFGLVADNVEVQTVFERSLDTLAKHLPQYESGYWSYYNTQGLLSSPFYHNLHIHQLGALALISINPVFSEYQQHWRAFQNNCLCKSRAFITKAIQKLREPPEVTIVG
jgi:hypothetical protein